MRNQNPSKRMLLTQSAIFGNIPNFRNLPVARAQVSNLQALPNQLPENHFATFAFARIFKTKIISSDSATAITNG